MKIKKALCSALQRALSVLSAIIRKSLGAYAFNCIVTNCYFRTYYFGISIASLHGNIGYAFNEKRNFFMECLKPFEVLFSNSFFLCGCLKNLERFGVLGLLGQI